MAKNKTRRPEFSPKDRISQLPMELLLYLLTFLTSKEAAPMKLISRTWRKVVSLTYLSFYCKEFDLFGEENFRNYVDNSLLNREEIQVDKFQILWLDEKSNAWLDYAVERKVKVLHVILRDSQVVKLPQNILTCGSLEELTIMSYPKLKLPPKTLTLTSLNKLVLQATIIKNKSMKQIQLGCPSLEELHFIICRLENYEIRSKSLKRLTIERCRVGFGFDYEQFGIFTPNLEYLWYNAVWQGLLCKKPVRANYVSDVSTKILLEISNIKSLTLGGLWLTHDSHSMSYFLSNSPKLEQLMLLCNSPIICPVQDEIFAFLNFPFYCPNLRKVDIISWENDIRLSWLNEALTQNGVSEEKINVRFVVNKNCFRGGVKMLESLHEVWEWIESDVKRKYDEIARQLGKTREELKAEKRRMMNKRMNDILSAYFQFDVNILMPDLEDIIWD